MRTGVHRLEAALEGLAAPDLEDAKALQDVCGLWRRMSAELAPIIGAAGVRALLRRSVLLTGRKFDWLATLHPTEGLDPVEQLCDALAQQPRAIAVATNLLLVQTFYRLLAGLIGESLADRLLEPVLCTSSGGPSAQEQFP